jgi:hypothetical protein
MKISKGFLTSDPYHSHDANVLFEPTIFLIPPNHPDTGMPPVMNLVTLAALAKEKRAVHGPKWMHGKPKPALFLLSMQGTSILKAFELGVYPYVKPTKTGHNTFPPPGPRGSTI